MHPAFSVIFFTTLSGAGFGLWFWLGLRIAFGSGPGMFEGIVWMIGLAVGALLVAAGVIASLWHLGKPARVWRAFSQWRSSWMSREGVMAGACYVPASAAVAILWWSDFGLPLRIAAAALAVGCIAAVYCTAMIYASLTPIPAWRHRLVVPIYVMFSVYTGGLLFGLCVQSSVSASRLISIGTVIGAITLWALKHRYWQDIDGEALSQTRGDAVGLPGRDVSVFERPHTESNYLTREMGFIVARKHAEKLRTISWVLFALIPTVCTLPVWLMPDADVLPLLALASVSALLGAMVERWLFFAEAKHLVTLYY